MNHLRCLSARAVGLLMLLPVALGLFGFGAWQYDEELPDGNYRVELLLTTAADSARACVFAESRRLMVYDADLRRGDTLRVVFCVNKRDSLLRGQEGSAVRIKANERQKPNWDNLLSLSLAGEGAECCGIDIAPAPESVPTVWLCGNSTVVDQDADPWASWGQMITAWFGPGVCFANLAESGESAETFIANRRWAKLLSMIRPGDYVIIEFGHNDQKQHWPGAGAYYNFATALKQMIDEARAAGATPVLATPTCRRSFGEHGSIVPTHGDYPDAMRQVAQREGVALIDLQAKTKALYEALGLEGSKAAFVHYPANTFPDQPAPLADNTHFNPYGAYEIAKLVVEGMMEIGLPITSSLRPGCSLAMGDPELFYWPWLQYSSPARPDGDVAPRSARPLAGSTRRGDNPVLFLVGNSTMRNGTLGNGDNGQWGWGYFLPDLFDQEKITVENHALGGMSSRTFYRQLWPDVLKGMRQGDWVIIELGHNDNGPYDSGRARASIPGIGRDSIEVTIQETGLREVVYSYGEYLRRYVDEARARGARPVLMSLTPRNLWVDPDSTEIVRCNGDFGLWAKQIAEEKGVPFVDLNGIIADKYERYGKEKVKTMFYLDRIHTSEYGARDNAASAAEGLRANGQAAELAALLLPEQPCAAGASRKPGCPVAFTIGDSTVKNEDDGPDSMWGWGSVLAERLDTARISVENHAFPGRSARTFIDEGRWQRVYDALEPGDFVIIQFGHNDAGDINTGKARAELPGAGGESRVFKMEATGQNKVVYTFGWYLRKMVYDALEKGAIPVLVSHTPRNIFDGGAIQSNASSFGLWTRQVADQTGAYYVDLNAISGHELQRLANEQGLNAVNSHFCRDHTHTSLKGARLNARSLEQGLKNTDCPLNQYFADHE